VPTTLSPQGELAARGWDPQQQPGYSNARQGPRVGVSVGVAPAVTLAKGMELPQRTPVPDGR
jgi:hypothetical protein